MKLADTLRTMLNRGEISNYIVAEIPPNNLQTGWIERNLLLQFLDGNPQDEANRNGILIPTDRFVRLHRDTLLTDFQSCGVLVFGSETNRFSRLITVILPDSERGAKSYLAVSLHSEQSDLTTIVCRLVGASKSVTVDEPQLGYLERMRADVVEGRFLEFLSLKIPKANIKPKEWIRDKQSIIEIEGDTQSVQRFAHLLIRWIVGLQLIQETETPIMAALLLGPRATLVCLWDGPNGLASFAVARGVDIHEHLMHYVTPLWSQPAERGEPYRGFPRVTVETSSSQSPTRVLHVGTGNRTPEKKETTIQELEKTFTTLSARLTSIPLDDLERRLKDLESGISASSKVPRRKELADTEAMQRFNETLERLEQVTKRMKELEKRIERIAKRME